MRNRQSGCIINVSSVAGRMALAAESAYCASKFALEAMSEALACDVKAHNIRIAIVEPGAIETPIFIKSSSSPKDTLYPQSRRQHAIFQASRKNHVSPFAVGEIIREIIDSSSGDGHREQYTDKKKMY